VTSGLGNDNLLASFYTLSGAPTGQPARHGFEARVGAAAEAGYAGIGLSGFDISSCVAGGLTLDEMAKIGADHGAPVIEVESPSSVSLFASDDANDDPAIHELCTMGEQLGARHMIVSIGRPPGAALDSDAAFAAFAHVCDIAAEHGLLVAFEFMPLKVIGRIDQAFALVQGAGRVNGGLVIDAYHFFRGGSSLEDLAAVPGELIVVAQLSDVPFAGPDTLDELLVEVRTGRLLPGVGELPLIDLVSTLDRIGSAAPITVDILSTELQALSADDAARSTYDAARTVLRAARAT
jgi:sugar phosphate isomerase/epimerase